MTPRFSGCRIRGIQRLTDCTMPADPGQRYADTFSNSDHKYK
ncbi:hypothetical protein BZL30_3997 [Mycobacterium kansasii]|uniref:Uncharacterized protein n=1 Tax=Mycobacterium kansasii TaxID=1768 RepID=A0A1V3XBK1_MYCKA|nr:hypothetical protein BZL30_3997 [Mycobacterium kansasii]